MSPTAPGYRRSLGLVELVCLGIGGTIGSGIFVVPGEAARLAGASSLLAWVVVAVSAGSVAYALAALQARATHGASLPALLAEGFGKRTGALLVALYVLASLFGIATIAAGLGQYLTWLGGASMRAYDVPVEIAIVFAFLLLNLRGMAASGSAENLLSVLKIGGILAIVLVLLPDVAPQRLVPLPLAPAPALLHVVIIVYWSFTGFEISAIPVDEAKDPRTIGRALWWVMLLVCAIYLALNVALLGAVGAQALGASDAPLADAVAHLFLGGGVLPGAGAWVAVLAIVTMLSALNAYIVGASRALQGVAEIAGLSALARLSSQGVPAQALWLTCLGAAALLCLSGSFAVLAAAAVTLTLVPYVAICWSAFVTVPQPGARALSLFGALVTAAILVAYLAS